MQESVKSAVNLTKSLEGTCAQLQAELRNTDAENNRLTVQLQVHRPQGKAYWLIFHTLIGVPTFPDFEANSG